MPLGASAGGTDDAVGDGAPGEGCAEIAVRKKNINI